jgi:RHS repeat-associated protein
VIERDLYGPAVDMILAIESPLPLGEGQGEGVLAGPVTWPLADNQGTIRDVAEYDEGTDTTSVVDHLVYDAFGQIDSQTSAVDQPRFTYTGRPFDSAVELYNYRARWYDAVNGVFASADPLGFGGGDTNLSRYCGNSPANFVDPSGTISWNPLNWADDVTNYVGESAGDIVQGVYDDKDAGPCGRTGK